MAAVDFRREGRIAVLTMEGDTDLNVGMTGPLLHERLREYGDDDDLWCAIITGAGERAFSAGGNVKSRAERAEGGGEPAPRGFWESRRNPALAALDILSR